MSRSVDVNYKFCSSIFSLQDDIQNPKNIFRQIDEARIKNIVRGDMKIYHGTISS